MARSTWTLLLIVVASFASAAPALPASLVLDASVQEVHEDSINPLLSGARRVLPLEEGTSPVPAGARIGAKQPAPHPASRSGDLYTLARAAAGFSTLAGPGTDLSVTLRLERADFNRFIGLNATSVGVSGSLLTQFTDVHSVYAALACGRRWYDADGMTGNSCGGSFELRQQTALKFWVGEGLQYERQSARDPGSALSGRIMTLRSGYRFRNSTSVVVTYTDMVRSFNDGSRIVMRSVGLAGAEPLTRHIRALASLEHQRIASDPAGSRSGNNILSLGVACSY